MIAALAEKADAFVYDPGDPAPTRGGPLCCPLVENGRPAIQLLPGPRDQRPVEARADVLVYSTPVLKQAIEVTGPVSVELFASSLAADTDFTAKRSTSRGGRIAWVIQESVRLLGKGSDHT